MKNKSIRNTLVLLTTIAMLMAILPVAAVQGSDTAQAELMATTVEFISQDDYQFKDLNKNNALDPYEDWRLTAEERAKDLLSQMTANEKAAQMVHLTLVTMKESWFRESNVGFALAYTYLAEGPAQAVALTNQVQQLSEESRLGIPVVLSMDSVIGASWVDGRNLPAGSADTGCDAECCTSTGTGGYSAAGNAGAGRSHELVARCRYCHRSALG